MEPIFREADAPFTIKEIARSLGMEYEAVRAAHRRLQAKPETRDKVQPLGESRYHEFSAEAANFLARRCAKNVAARQPLADRSGSKTPHKVAIV